MLGCKWITCHFPEFGDVDPYELLNKWMDENPEWVYADDPPCCITSFGYMKVRVCLKSDKANEPEPHMSSEMLL